MSIFIHEFRTDIKFENENNSTTTNGPTHFTGIFFNCLSYKYIIAN